MTQREHIEALRAEITELREKIAKLEASPRVEYHYHSHYAPVPVPSLPPAQPWQPPQPWITSPNVCQSTPGLTSAGIPMNTSSSWGDPH